MLPLPPAVLGAHRFGVGGRLPGTHPGIPPGRPGPFPAGPRFGPRGEGRLTPSPGPFAVFDERDRAQLRARGLTEERALAQLEAFRTGRSFAVLDRPCAVNDGIARLSQAEAESFAAACAAAAAQGRFLCFVPASGAATRMFKGLAALRHRKDRPDLQGLAKEAGRDADARETLEWFTHVREFAFYPALRDAVARAGADPEASLAAGDYGLWLEALLGPAGLGYADKPKALIPFHASPAGPRLALEEHLAEAAALARDAEGRCRLHFTVSPEHESAILAALERARLPYEAEGVRFEISLSAQKPATDTLAADAGNLPFRDAEGRLVFRPGGHGALLENLHHTGGDLVFIKNIDNVVPASRRAPVLAFRRVLGGYLAHLQERIRGYARDLASRPDARLVEEAAHFAAQRLGASPPEPLRAPPAGAEALAAKAAWLSRAFARPLRVCAMVKNTGEPGGGPFWVRHADGSVRPQIVETAQVDLSQSAQRKILESATHFNPVDMACALRDPEGHPYKLQDFVDPSAALITEKSKDGKPLKALELPGLWNGSMAFWNTAFVEAPLETFNPVKTVNDLLRENHRG